MPTGLRLGNVYRLDPIDFDNPRWSASRIKKAVWAAADSPDEARRLVAGKTVRAVPAKPGAPKVGPSPWLDDRITTCVWEASRTDVAKGRVVDEQGRDI
jgi:hypothetical protein